MKALTCALLLAAPVFLPPQEVKEKWQRVYTGEDSIIEIDISKVTFVEYQISKKVTFASTRIGRVRFRTVFAKPQTISEKSVVKYKTLVETIEFECAQNRPEEFRRYPQATPTGRYRRYDAVLLDTKGKVVKSYEPNPAQEWREARFGGMMDKLSGPACTLIDEKRRKP